MSLEMKMGNWMIKYRGSWRPFSGFLGSNISAGISGIFHLGLGISGIFQCCSKFWDLGFPFWQLGFWDFINLKSHFLDFLYKLSEIFGAMRHFSSSRDLSFQCWPRHTNYGPEKVWDIALFYWLIWKIFSHLPGFRFLRVPLFVQGFGKYQRSKVICPPP